MSISIKENQIVIDLAQYDVNVVPRDDGITLSLTERDDYLITVLKRGATKANKIETPTSTSLRDQLLDIANKKVDKQ